MKKTESNHKSATRRFGITARIGFQDERDYFLDNFAMLLQSGADPLGALFAIRQELENKKMHTLITEMEEDINMGMNITDAFEKSTLFSAREIALLRIGEETGKIPESLDLLAKQEEKDRQLSSKIRSASMYPVFVLSIAFIIGISISWFILPKLAQVFDQLHLALPLPTRILIAVGKFLQQWGVVAVPSFMAIIAGLSYIVFFYHRTKFIGQKILLRTPGVGRLIMEAEVARFGSLFGTLLEAGVPIVVAFESLIDATGLFAYKKLYTHLRERTIDGHALREGFASYPNSKKLIPTAVMHMVCAGADSGRLARTLISVGERYEAKAEQTTKNLSTLLEPALIILVWLGVVTMAFAIITPIYSLIGGIHT